MKWNIWRAHPEDRRFIHDILRKSPPEFWSYIQSSYNEKFVQHGRRDANLFMLELQDIFNKTNFRLASDDNDIIDRAKKEAKTCSRLMANSKTPSEALKKLTQYAQELGISLPHSNTTKGALSRFRCEKWWRRKLRTLHGQLVEAVARKLNIVNKHSHIYASDAAIKRRRSQRQRNRAILESMQAINELEQEFTLAELADLSVANPKLRRAELMTRIAGNEKIADELDHISEFYTLTCPSRMHSAYARSGKPNNKFDETTPKEAHEYLNLIWSHIRADLSNHKVNVYGIRVVEPHHDGTPHWHFLLFLRACDQATVRNIFRKHALKIDGSEPGAEKHRFKAISIDKSKGTATGYVAKYVSKNIDGFGLEADLYGHNAKSSAERVDAYASTWRIRLFQFIGNPPVSIWRELRRIKTSSDFEIAEAIEAADNGDWATFIRVMGGPCSKKADQPIRLLWIWSDKIGAYDEPVGLKILGVEFDLDYLITRIHYWEIKYIRPDFSQNSGERISPPLEFCQ